MGAQMDALVGDRAKRLSAHRSAHKLVHKVHKVHKVNKVHKRAAERAREIERNHAIRAS